MLDKTEITREECIEFMNALKYEDLNVIYTEDMVISLVEATIAHLTTPSERELPELSEGVFIILENTSIKSEPWMCSVCVDYANDTDFSVMGKTPRAAVLAAIQAIKGDKA